MARACLGHELSNAAWETPGSEDPGYSNHATHKGLL